MEEEGKKGLYIVIIVLLSISTLGLGGFLFYDKVIMRFFPKDDQLVNSDEVSIDLNSFYQISDILDSMDTAFNESRSSFFGYLYKSKKITAKTFDENAALFAAAYRYLAGTGTPHNLANGYVKSNFETIFEKEKQYSPKTINAGENFTITYNSSTSNYEYTVPVISRAIKSGYYHLNTKTVVETDKIVITRKVFYAEYDTNSDGSPSTSATIYKQSDKKKKIGTYSLRNGTIDEREVISKMGSKMDSYTITFKYNKQDDYSFYSIEKNK